MKNSLKNTSRWGVVALAIGTVCCSATLFAADAKSELSSADKDFMMTAAKGGMKEVHMGQMAQKEGKSADVKKLGGTMVADHTKANNELMALAKKKGVTLDKTQPTDKMDMGSDFDSAWLSQMVTDHEKTISDFETEAKSGSDADTKSWANKTLPTLKKHLKELQAAQGKMKKS